MAKFIAEMEMYHKKGEASQKLADHKATVTGSAPGFFARIVGEKLEENRRAEDLSQLTLPTMIQLHFSLSEAVGGTRRAVDPQNKTKEEVEQEVLDRLESFADLLSGEFDTDSKNTLS